MKPDEKQRHCIKTYTEAKRNKNLRHNAISALQDGTKITQKRIADYMGMSPRNLRRYKTQKYDELIEHYNISIKSTSKISGEK